MQNVLNKLIDSFSKVRVLCIGDIMLDRFVQGKVERISPEAPVPIFQFLSQRQMLGGAGNVVANLRTLGCSTYFLGMVGKDALGDEVAALLREQGADFYLLKSHLRPTIMKSRFIAGSNHILRFDQEKVMSVGDREEKELLAVLKKQIQKTDIVMLSDYGKGLLTATLTPQIIAMCLSAGKKVLIDPKGNDYSKYAGAFIIKPNRKELELASGVSLDMGAMSFKSAVIGAARKVLKACNIQNMIVTLSEKGMLFVPGDETAEDIYLSTYAREVFDVSGAGDTSLAVLGAALAAGADIRQAMELSNMAAGVVVGKLGTATVTLDELRHEVGLKDF